MEHKTNMDYTHILGLIQQLSETDKEKIVKTLQSEMATKKSSASYKDLIQKAPTWSDSDLGNFNTARKHLNNSRLA